MADIQRSYDGVASSPEPQTSAGSTAKLPLGARVRRFFSRAALVVGSTAVALGIGEGVTRLLFPPIRGVSWYHYDTRYRFRHRENVDTVTNEWGDRNPWRFRTNARGFRYPEWPDAPSPGTTRALVMGDSFTFGNALEGEQTFPAVAQATLRASGEPSWEVINAGVSAWGPQNALGFLETEGTPIQASCLVYSFFQGNDVADGIAPQRIYELKDGRYARIPTSAAPPVKAARVREAMRSFPLYDVLLERSELFNIFRMAMMRRIAKNDPKGTMGSNDPYLKSTPEQFEEALKLNDATLDHLLALARSRFGAFALVLIPEQGQVTVEAKMKPTFPLWMAEASHERVMAWASAHAVPVLDLEEILPKDPSELAKFYFTRDFHLNAQGHGLLGRALAERLPSMCAKR